MFYYRLEALTAKGQWEGLWMADDFPLEGRLYKEFRKIRCDKPYWEFVKTVGLVKAEVLLDEFHELLDNNPEGRFWFTEKVMYKYNKEFRRVATHGNIRLRSSNNLKVVWVSPLGTQVVAVENK